MAKKQSDAPEGENALEQRVDALMGGEKMPKASAPAPAPKPAPAAVLDHPTAPELPGHLMQTLPGETVGSTSTEPAAAEASENEPEKLADPVTDKAVEDLVAEEGDTLLAVDDARAAKRNKEVTPEKSGWKQKLKAILKNKWTWVAIVALLIIAFAVPFTRYKLLGLVVKKSVTVTVLDSKTNTPVSSAHVELAGASAKTDANGEAEVTAGVGKQTLDISKQYYKSSQSDYFVSFKSGQSKKVKLEATGRLVPVTVQDKVTGKPVAGATVTVLDTTAKTDKQGKASIALPADKQAYNAKISFSGYATAEVQIQATNQVVKANTFELVPGGQIYFLSNLNGTIDVVKSNLDGSGRKVVLEGTGREDPNTTSPLASRDWRWLVLKARRDGGLPALYLIDTQTGKATPFENGNADYTLVGWHDHNFVYSLLKNGQDYWQTGRQALKSYDADRQQLNLLDQNQAEGAAGNYAYQEFSNFYIVNDAVTYSTQWYGYNSGGTFDGNNKTATIRAVQPNGQNKKDYQSFPLANATLIQATLYEPQEVYYAVYNPADNKYAYYKYENRTVSQANIDQSAFQRSYPTYLVSPSGKLTFWSELRDGKNTLFTGDAAGGSKKQVASHIDYAAYGWYSDDYLLVSKDNSELYIMPVGGLRNGKQPLKVTGYYKPAQTYPGYGYGYGGL